MRIVLFILLFCVPRAFSDSLWQSHIYECQNQTGFERQLELKYQTPSSPIPCRVVLFRGDIEKSKVEHVIFSAQHEAGKCEAKEKDYLSKMKSWNVSCRLVTPVESSVRQVTEAEAPKAESKVPSGVQVPQESKGELAPEPPPLEEYRSEWAGFYAGVILGAQFGHSSDKTGAFGYNADNQEWDYNESGFNGGAEFGYSYPFHGIVVGPEIDLGFLTLGGSGAQPNSPGSDTVGQTSSDFYSALRARVGVDVGHYLLFAAGGAIGVNYEKQVVDNCSIAPCGGSTVDASSKAFQWGYTVGGGVERSFVKGWSIKLEYLYFNLGSQSFSGATNLGVQYDWTGQTSGHIIRGGLNYHF